MNTKKEFKFFTIFDYEKEQDYLRRMHNQGWKFVDVGGIFVYRFQQCTPEDVVYQLDYNQDSASNKDEYIRMFEDCGWEYLFDFVGYSYFCKPVSAESGPEEIFCDDASRLQMLGRVFKGRMLPLLILFLCVLLPQFFINIVEHQNYLLATFLGGVIAVDIWVLFSCIQSYAKYKRRH